MSFVELLIFLAALVALVMVHEWGHFWAARRAGMVVQEFAFGFPPRLWSKVVRGTRYAVNLLPLGGYVKILGEDATTNKSPGAFGSKGLGWRAGVLSAGGLTNLVHYDALTAIVKGITLTLGLIWLIISGVWQMLAGLLGGVVPTDVAGPVGIATLTAQMHQLGLPYLLRFVGLLSVNLAVINILPLPALDGGRLAFLLLEKIRRRAVAARVEQWVHALGFALLILLILVITFNDLKRF